MNVSTWSDEDLVEELTKIIEDMVRQYLTTTDGEIIKQQVLPCAYEEMEAGERSLVILEALGKVETPNFIHYTWAKEGS